MKRPTGGWRYLVDTEILFPMRVAPQLAMLRGEAWKELVGEVSADSADELDQAAFSLTLVELCGCLTCHTDCYRAIKGCSECATRTIQRYKGTDSDLIHHYRRAKERVWAFLQSRLRPKLPVHSAVELELSHGS